MTQTHPWGAWRSAIARSCRNAGGAALLVLGVAAPGSALATLNLPGMNLNAYCAWQYGSGAFSTLTQQNAFGWSCYKNGQYLSMDLTQACLTQHPNSNIYQAAYQTFSDPYSWYCQRRGTYTSQPGAQHTLYIWKGQKVTLHTPDVTTCTVSQIKLVVDGLDNGYTFYQDMTGRTPSSGRSYQGTDSLAILPSGVATGCGSASDPACGDLGSHGIEFKFDLFQLNICTDAAAGKHNQVGFYELGRNFWFYGPQLASNNGNYGHAMVTGYAVLNRFLAMEYYGLPVSSSHTTLYTNVKNLMTAYQADVACGTVGATSTPISPGSTRCFKHDWANTLLVRQGIGGFDTTDLFASFVLKLKSVHNWSFIFQLWRKVEQLGSVTSPYSSADNFVLAASRAANVNLSDVFQYTWRWPVSSSIRITLQNELGNPVSGTPYL
ncbi:calcium-binding protein [Myxococcus sp. CA051A]|uniref:calcium-binding protein n=1 Tax=Myxococcus sp. CA051A TaxID=2741739 RepID=UPI0020C6A3FA|nr:calcium-binding protein [Myxococcus sp. CA051A]